MPCPFLTEYDRMSLRNGLFVTSEGLRPGDVFISDWNRERFVVVCTSETHGMSVLRRITPDEIMEAIT